MNYNKSQQQAIRHKDGPMLVLAGPGSGKTAVITQRTKQLIEYENIDPSNILVITFTRAAAQEMKQRFLAATGEERTKVTFGTFHAIFFMVLKLAYHFDSGNIISEEQRYQFMREILSYHHLEYRDEGEFIGDVLTEISRVKNEQIPLEHFYSSSCGEEVFRKIYREYDDLVGHEVGIYPDFTEHPEYTDEGRPFATATDEGCPHGMPQNPKNAPPGEYSSYGDCGGCAFFHREETPWDIIGVCMCEARRRRQNPPL